MAVYLELPLKPIAVRCVYEISSKFDVPIIGCGGISTWQDAVEFILAGACAVQFGSVLGEHWTEVFCGDKQWNSKLYGTKGIFEYR